MRFETAWCPHLEFVPDAHDHGLTLKAGVFDERLRQQDAPVAVDPERDTVAKQRDGKLVTLV